MRIFELLTQPCIHMHTFALNGTSMKMHIHTHTNKQTNVIVFYAHIRTHIHTYKHIHMHTFALNDISMRIHTHTKTNKQNDVIVFCALRTEIPTIIDPSTTVNYPSATGSIIVGISVCFSCCSWLTPDLCVHMQGKLRR